MAFGDVIGYAYGYKSQITGTAVEYLDTSEPVIEIPIIELNKPRSSLRYGAGGSFTTELGKTLCTRYARMLDHYTVAAVARQVKTFSVGFPDHSLFTFQEVANFSRRFALTLSNSAAGKSYSCEFTELDSYTDIGFAFGYSPEANAYFPMRFEYRAFAGESDAIGYLPKFTGDSTIVNYWPTTLERCPLVPVFFSAAQFSGLMAGRQLAGQRKKRQTAMYRYNGSKLPDINTVWTDKDTRPNAVIMMYARTPDTSGIQSLYSSLTVGRTYLITSSGQFRYNTEYATIDAGKGHYRNVYEYEEVTQRWLYKGEFGFGLYVAWWDLLWSQEDIYNGTATAITTTLYYSGSEPVPV